MTPLQSGQSCASFSRPCWFCRFFPLASRADNNASSRREAAKAQFDRAEKDREALEARPENARTLKDYTALVIEYQRVYLITPHAAEVPASLNQVAELFRTMGDLFDAKYYQRSIDSFQFLLREYPTSKYREDALLAIAHIEQDDLHDSALAQKTYEQFLALHPRSSHAAEVRAILDKLNAASATGKTAPGFRLPPRTTRTGSLPKRSPRIRLRRRRTRNKDRPRTIPTRLAPARKSRGFAPGTPIPILAS